LAVAIQMVHDAVEQFASQQANLDRQPDAARQVPLVRRNLAARCGCGSRSSSSDRNPCTMRSNWDAGALTAYCNSSSASSGSPHRVIARTFE